MLWLHIIMATICKSDNGFCFKPLNLANSNRKQYPYINALGEEITDIPRQSYSELGNKFLIDENYLLYDLDGEKIKSPGWIPGFSNNTDNEGVKYSRKYDAIYPGVIPEDFMFNVIDPSEGQGEKYYKYKDLCNHEIAVGGGVSGSNNKFRDLYLIHRELDLKERNNKSLEEILLSNN